MIQSYVYSLTTPNGGWLGQVVLTSDGMFASVTDWGNFSYAWRGFGKDFREFILSLNNDYFGSKMAEGNAYILYSKNIDIFIMGACPLLSSREPRLTPPP